MDQLLNSYVDPEYVPMKIDRGEDEDLIGRDLRRQYDEAGLGFKFEHYPQYQKPPASDNLIYYVGAVGAVVGAALYFT